MLKREDIDFLPINEDFRISADCTAAKHKTELVHRLVKYVRFFLSLNKDDGLLHT